MMEAFRPFAVYKMDLDGLNESWNQFILQSQTSKKSQR